MADLPAGLKLPANLDDIDPAFMTRVLRHVGVIDADNEVVSQQEQGVGMTAGYFSAIKKIACTYARPAHAQTRFVAKTWPPFEIAPKPDIQAMFMKDIKGYQLPAESFFPRPRVYLAACDPAEDRWALIMEDVDSFAEHKVHEVELDLSGVLRMIPRMAAVAAAWEGCHTGDKARVLDEVGVEYWASSENLGRLKATMPGSARLFDKLTSMEGTSMIGDKPWPSYVGGPGVCEMLVRRFDAFFHNARPENGATCTLAHGDLRGDNLFFCEDNPAYPDGWLCIDYQQIFRGPVPSDLADLLGSGSVLPEVYTGENLTLVLRTFYEHFMAKTILYRDYTYERFTAEYAMMSVIHFVYFLAFGAPIWQAGAYHNDLGVRVELGNPPCAESDLPPEQVRQRMWWRKALVNYRENLHTFNHYDRLRTLPESLDGLGAWADLPPHLQ